MWSEYSNVSNTSPDTLLWRWWACEGSHTRRWQTTGDWRDVGLPPSASVHLSSIFSLNISTVWFIKLHKNREKGNLEPVNVGVHAWKIIHLFIMKTDEYSVFMHMYIYIYVMSVIGTCAPRASCRGVESVSRRQQTTWICAAFVCLLFFHLGADTAAFREEKRLLASTAVSLIPQLNHPQSERKS